MVDSVLERAKLSIRDIDAFAVTNGPGSFTGIRIGVSTIKAFLDATGKKAVGITSLEGLAYNVQEDGIICSLIDAKNNNVYCGFFEKKEERIIQIGDFKFANINDIIHLVKNINKDITFVVDGSEIYKNIIKSKVAKNYICGKCFAKNIGFAAYNKRGNAVDTNKLIPVYLRKSNAERLQK